MKDLKIEKSAHQNINLNRDSRESRNYNLQTSPFDNNADGYPTHSKYSSINHSSRNSEVNLPLVDSKKQSILFHDQKDKE